MYEVEVQDHFSAAHFLKWADGSTEPRHGHDWCVAVRVCRDELDSIGVVTDFEVLKHELRRTLDAFEKRLFNEHPDFKGVKRNPSTENIAKLIYEKLRMRFDASDTRISRVTVWETPDACASFIPNA